MSSTRATPARSKILPRGPHQLTRKDVLSSQRDRLLRAMLDLVGRQGYASTTVPDVVARAKVSRNAFYELFRDKEECFLAMLTGEAGRFSDEVLGAAMRDMRNWQDAVRLGIRAALSWWSQRPALARAYFQEMPMVLVGERAVAHRGEVYRPFEELLKQAAQLARLEQPGRPPLHQRIPHFLITGITETIGDEVRAGRTDRLPDLEESLTHITVMLLAGRSSEPA